MTEQSVEPVQSVRLPLVAETPLEPPAEWEQLRSGCPVAHATLPSGDSALYLTRYEDVKRLLSDDRFVRPTAADNAARLAPEGQGGVGANGTSGPYTVPGRGEPHLRWRRRVGRWFTAKRMTALRPRMAQLANELIDAMAAGGAPADLRAGLGFPLPVYVICDLLGVPAEHRDRFSHWSDAFLSVTRYTPEEIKSAHEDFIAYMSAHIETRRRDLAAGNPAEDLLSTLIRESEEGEEGLTDPELVATGMGLLVAGHETTANMIGKMTAMLLSDRTRWEQLLADPSLIRTAVEESLRFDTDMGFGMRRYLNEETEIAGQAVPAGTTVICAMAAANRDASVFEGAEEMDLSRSPNTHLTFGAGVHSCLGQALARTELQVVLETLLTRLPGLRLAVPVAELPRNEGLLVGGFAQLPVAW